MYAHRVIRLARDLSDSTVCRMKRNVSSGSVSGIVQCSKGLNHNGHHMRIYYTGSMTHLALHAVPLDVSVARHGVSSWCSVWIGVGSNDLYRNGEVLICSCIVA